MGKLPNVNIILGNGALGRVAQSSDGVVGLILTGTAIADKLELNKTYVLGSIRDIVSLGVTAENNKLVDKDVKAFYTTAGEGAELHLIVTSEATTLTQMCATEATSPLSKLIESAAGRVRIVGVNKIAPVSYEPDLTQGIDSDAITAMQAAHNTANSFATRPYPFRVLLPAPNWNGETDTLFKPSEASCNRVAMVLASDDKGETAAIGQILGRAASLEPHQSLGRVLSGQIAAVGHFTDGSTMTEKASLGDILHDAGYVFYRSFTTRNGCYLNGSPMCAPVTDDYSTLELGRVIDKAIVQTYAAYISQIQDNVDVDSSGQLDAGVCASYESMLENALNISMAGQISSITVFIDPDQSILSSGAMDVVVKIIPKGVLSAINVDLSFSNPTNN